jgi:hypothetical protein
MLAATLIGLLFGYLLGCTIVDVSGLDYKYSTTYRPKGIHPGVVIFVTTAAGGLVGFLLS